METEQTGFRIPWWAKVLMGFAALALLGLGTIYLMGIAERGRWESYAASLREAGEPLTFAEIEARRAEVPDDQNSALVIEDALFDHPPIEIDSYPPSFVLVLGGGIPVKHTIDSIPGYALEPSRAYLEKSRPLLDALRPILATPTGRVELAHAKNPINTLLPELSGIRHAAKLARLNALLRLVDGDVEGATDDVVMQFRAAGSLDGCPSLIAGLVALACDGVGIETTEDILRTGELSEAALARVGDVVRSRDRASPMLTGMRAERAMAVEFYDLLASGEVSLQGAIGTTSSKVLPEFIIRKNQIRAVELFTSMVEAGEDTAAMYEAALQLDAQVPPMGSTYFIVRMMTPSVSRAVFLQLQHEIKVDATLAGLAAERFRLASNRWPASLTELVPAYLDEVPEDPFDEGKPLKLARTDRGIVIYSIGEDKTDDGGVVTKQEDLHNTPDIGFRLLDPEHRGVVITDEPRPDEG